ncbi:MAG: thioredoxin [Thioalkalispiraceae bacterium]|jgi:putative thioredoxin
MSQSPYIIDVNEQNFAQQVIEASQQALVLVDFWATWCGPCQTLVPLLEKLADEYQGKFILAKVDVDQNQQLAGHFGVRSVPTVKLVKQGQIVDEFTGVIPDVEIRNKLDAHIENESQGQLEQALALHQQGETQQALEIMQQLIIDEPDNHSARVTFARILLDVERGDDARQLLDSLPDEEKNKPEARALLAQLELSESLADAPAADELRQRIDRNPDDCEARYLLSNHLLAQGEYEDAMEQLLQIILRDRDYNDDAGRKGLVKVFDMLGGSGELVSRYRRKLANALN